MKRNPELERISKAAAIIQEACEKAWPLVDEEYLYEQYEMGFSDLVTLMAKTMQGTWPDTSGEANLLCDIAE